MFLNLLHTTNLRVVTAGLFPIVKIEKNTQLVQRTLHMNFSKFRIFEDISIYVTFFTIKIMWMIRY